ncbi:hypothetical protein [Catenuloplanes atrovinosus]|uniref:Uncharacterized protein n=1 Tax=Catenuloplanes atrovinosus TaxID=137266 RepID=A0AAE4C8M6_9ACTN|nr:hypothetical protein [Catenuloplanes atrovinosus]MDR7275143.1 hypothetical protein [Catenuloplanes atrovinosus]
MSEQFDWQLTSLPRWTPASRFGTHHRMTADRRGRLLRVREDVYLMANKAMGAGADDPGVGAVLWARSADAAMLIVTSAIPDSESPDSACRPPAAFLGFSPVTYERAESYERAHGFPLLQERVEYRFTDGRFLFFALSRVGREYIFASVEPQPEDEPIGIRFELLPAS